MVEIRISCLLVAISISGFVSDAFVPRFVAARYQRDCVTHSEFAVSSALNVKKRRRRRNLDGGEASVEADTISGDLPDFDLDDDEEGSTPKPQKRTTSKPAEITPAMMGSSDGPERSIKDLLLDRSLESKFDFGDVETDDSLPDLIAMSKTAEQVDAQTGKKKARQAERRASAIAAKESATESAFPILPFVSDEEGKVQPVKLLEAGAWTGIFLLVAWEVYLNSPFFERAAPMAPVVFENFVL